MFLAFSMSFARCHREPGPELLYGAPADGFINTFPVMTIDPNTGGFSDFFNVTAPPPFLCSGGETAVGSKFLYVSVPPGSCLNQVGEIIGYSLDQKTGVPSPIPGSPFILRPGASPNGMVVGPNGDILYAADAEGYMMHTQSTRNLEFQNASRARRSRRALPTSSSLIPLENFYMPPITMHLVAFLRSASILMAR